MKVKYYIVCIDGNNEVYFYMGEGLRSRWNDSSNAKKNAVVFNSRDEVNESLKKNNWIEGRSGIVVLEEREMEAHDHYYEPEKRAINI